MIDKNEISNELRELKINIPHLRMPERDMPSSYFDELQNELFAQIEQSEIENHFCKTNPFQAPEAHYFENLHQQIIEMTATEQFINQLPKQVPFHVDKNYFDNQHQQILQKISSNKPSRISPLQIIYRNISIAASIILFIGSSFFLMKTKQPHFENADTSKAIIENKLSQLPDIDIQNYIQEHELEFDNQITFQKIDDSKVDIHSLENDIYNSFFEDISKEDIQNLL